VPFPSLTDTSVHVVPGRKGVWIVRGMDDPGGASVYTSETEAERAAQRYAHARGATHVVLHDRYARFHVAPVDTR
jgi:hypothetical protein